MNIKQMISAMQVLGIGEVYSDSKSKEIALLFLNLAHDQLYSETANLNDKVSIRDNNVLNVIGQSYIELSQEPFYISTVYIVGHNFPLLGLSDDDYDKYTIRDTRSSLPEVYNNSGKIVNIFSISPDVSYPFNVRFTPKRTELEENTPESAIPYPVEYHRVLLNGALYYMFQDESGFKNTLKENEASKRWDEGRLDLLSYFKSKNKKRMSTFENA